MSLPGNPAWPPHTMTMVYFDNLMTALGGEVDSKKLSFISLLCFPMEAIGLHKRMAKHVIVRKIINNMSMKK